MVADDAVFADDRGVVAIETAKSGLVLGNDLVMVGALDRGSGACLTLKQSILGRFRPFEEGVEFLAYGLLQMSRQLQCNMRKSTHNGVVDLRLLRGGVSASFSSLGLRGRRSAPVAGVGGTESGTTGAETEGTEVVEA